MFRPSFRPVVVFAVAVVAAFHLVGRAESAREAATRDSLGRSRTGWDSVYASAQATRGDPLYHQTCAKCHGDTLSGGVSPTGDDAPALAGPPFLSNWNGQTLFDLYDKVLNGMPPDNPKTLDKQLIIDVMAFVLSKNGFPAGTAELPPDPAALRDIQIKSTKP